MNNTRIDYILYENRYEKGALKDRINEFNGVIINIIINKTDIPRHIHTFSVDLENSTIIREDVI